MKKLNGLMMTGICGLAAMIVFGGGPEDDHARFQGGFYDGWDSQSIPAPKGLGGPQVIMSSAADQVFQWHQPVVEIETIVITALEPMGFVDDGDVLRLRVPSDWQLRFDTAGSPPTFDGSAAAKINVEETAFSSDGRMLEILVTDLFEDDDELIVSGLRLTDLHLAPASVRRFELDFSGDGDVDAFDQKTLEVQVFWAGGAYDGWDYERTAELVSLEPPPRGTIFLIR